MELLKNAPSRPLRGEIGGVGATGGGFRLKRMKVGDVNTVLRSISVTFVYISPGRGLNSFNLFVDAFANAYRFGIGRKSDSRELGS